MPFLTAFADPFYLGFVGATLVLAGLLGYSAWRSAQLLRTWRPPFNPMLQPAENVVRVFLVVLCLLLGVGSRLEYGVLGWHASHALSQIGRGALWGLGLAFFFGAATRLLIAQTGRRFYSPLVMELILPRSVREFALLALAMLPAVLLEELLYRSLLIGGLSPLLGTHWLIIGVGIAFGLLHTPQGSWGVFGAALAGMLFGWLFVREGSLLLPLVAHYVANMAQIAWVYWGGGAPPAARSATSESPDETIEEKTDKRSGGEDVSTDVSPQQSHRDFRWGSSQRVSA